MHAAASKQPRKRTKTRPPSSSDRATDYARAVLAGEIIAGPHVRNACRRHLDDLEHGPSRGLRWNLEAAERVWKFFETVLVLSEGQFDGKPFKLHPSQAFVVGSIFGWETLDPTHGWVRRFRRAYIEQGKGNGKSPLVGGIGLYGLGADGEAQAEIYAAGANRAQAGILFADAVKMVKAAPGLSQRFTFSGGAGREYNIAYLKTGSFFRPVSRENANTGSGTRPSMALCDEIHEHKNRAVIDILEAGFKSRRQPLLVMITNSGSDRRSVCWEEHEHAVRVAAGTRTPGPDFAYVGEVVDDQAFSYVCGLDPNDDPLNDPTCWVKANPLLGTILTREYLAGEVAKAKALPGKRNLILRLHFCVWTDADTAWIDRTLLDKALADFDPSEHDGKKVNLGADLSRTQDLTAVGHVVETGEITLTRPDGTTVTLPTFDAWIEAWTPGDNIRERSERDGAPYEVWADEEIAAEEGRPVWLNATPGLRVRYDYVAAHVADIDSRMSIEWLAYDRYNIEPLKKELENANVEVRMIEHPQGGARRARAPQELIDAAKLKGEPQPEGLSMIASVAALEEAFLDGRIRLKRNPVLVAAIMSATLDEDAFGNRWFVKAKSLQRIDPLVSLAMAYGAAILAPAKKKRSPYEDRGIRTV